MFWATVMEFWFARKKFVAVNCFVGKVFAKKGPLPCNKEFFSLENINRWCQRKR